jgi:regulator of RNase E activity RraA
MLHMNVPVTVGGMLIEPGMLLHGDRNGITTIPLAIAGEVPDACRDFADAEKIIFDYLKRPNLTPAGLTEARQASQEAIGRIARGVSRGS